jgi:GT2 family glycosyltransferase
MIPDISVIIVSYNGKKHLELLLPKILEQNIPKYNFEIVLVDNGSRDDTLSFVSSKFKDIRIIPLKKNYGFSTSNWEGIKTAQGKYIALINNDCKVDSNWLENFLENVEENTILSGKILSWDGRKIDFIDGILTFDGHAFQKYQGFPLKDFDSSEKKYLPFPCGGNCFFEKEIFLKTGGFDSDFFAYLEDVDWGRRLWIYGYKVKFCPSSIVYHRGSSTGKNLGIFKRAYLFERNAFMVFYKNMEENLLKEFLPSVLLTFQHRLYYLLKEDSGFGTIQLDPYKNNKKREKIKSNSPHIINHLRAFFSLQENLYGIYKKREEVQKMRVFSDLEYFNLFPPHLIPTYLGDEVLFTNPLFLNLMPKSVNIIKKELKEIICL